MLCNSNLYQVPERRTLKGNLYPRSSHCPSSLSVSQPLATNICFPSISMDISYKWNHTICGLLFWLHSCVISSPPGYKSPSQLLWGPSFISILSLPFPAIHLCCRHVALPEIAGLGLPSPRSSSWPLRWQPFLGLPVELEEQQTTLGLLQGFHILK